MICDQCDAVMINGRFCHEHGCPNTTKDFVEGEWKTVYTCWTCGTEYHDEDDLQACCSPETSNEEEEETK